MSHGPGISQRRILDYLQDHAWGALATICANGDRTQYLSTLRAAHTLHEQGKIALIALRKGDTKRLIVCRPGEVDAFSYAWNAERSRLAKANAQSTRDWKQQVLRIYLDNFLITLHRTVPDLELTEAQRRDLEELRQACVPVLQWLSPNENPSTATKSSPL